MKNATPVEPGNVTTIGICIGVVFLILSRILERLPPASGQAQGSQNPANE